MGMLFFFFFLSKKHLLVVLPEIIVFLCKRTWTEQQNGSNKLDIQIGSQYGSTTKVAQDPRSTFATCVIIGGAVIPPDVLLTAQMVQS